MNQAKKKKKIFQDRYEILSIVGRGSCSVVYQGRLIDEPEKFVALKVLINKKNVTNLSDKLRKEALALVSARNKNVIGLNDFHSIGDLSYLAMEYASEADLATYIQKNKKLPTPQALKFIEQASEALAFVHKIGMLHRDIKPSNILVMNKNEIKLGDFGVALLPGEKVAIEELRKGVGTMDYMAPEVFEGKAYNEASDVYQLATSSYEILSGNNLFSDKALSEVLNVRKDENINEIENIDSKIFKVIKKGLAYNLDDRYKNGQEFLAAFQNALNNKDEEIELKEDNNTNEPDKNKEIEINDEKEENSSTIKEEETPKDKETLKKEKEDFFAFMEEMQKKIDKKKKDKENQELESENLNTDNIKENNTEENKEVENNTLKNERKEEDNNDSLEDIKDIESKDETKNEDSYQNDDIIIENSEVEDSKGSSFLSKALDNSYDTIDDEDIEDKNFNDNSTIVVERKKKSSAGWIKFLFILIILYVLYSKFIAPVFFDTKTSENETVQIENLNNRNSNSISALPSSQSGPKAFPNIATGTYVGEINDLIPGTSFPITLISEGNGGVVTLLVGINGWMPISIEPQSNSKSLVFRANGFMLEFKGEIDGMKLNGIFKNLIDNKTGTWNLKTILNN